MILPAAIGMLIASISDCKTLKVHLYVSIPPIVLRLIYLFQILSFSDCLLYLTFGVKAAVFSVPQLKTGLGGADLILSVLIGLCSGWITPFLLLIAYVSSLPAACRAGLNPYPFVPYLTGAFYTGIVMQILHHSAIPWLM
jgi:hypothetical protein